MVSHLAISTLADFMANALDVRPFSGTKLIYMKKHDLASYIY